MRYDQRHFRISTLRARFRARLILFNFGVEYPYIDIDVDLLLEDVGYYEGKTTAVTEVPDVIRGRNAEYMRKWRARRAAEKADALMAEIDGA